MKNLFWKVAPMIGALVLTIPMQLATASPLKIPEPDPGLLAAVDIQANALKEGIAMGDFEAWYPGLYPGYRWAREITEIGSNGLFRVDYAVFHARDRHRVAARELSLLLFRPESPPGSASGGARLPLGGQVAPPVPTADSRAAGPSRPTDRATASSLAARVIEDALVKAQMFSANARYYLFLGASQSLSLVSRLPDSFPGSESFGGAEVRRVSFYLRPGRHGTSDLVLEHAPLLLDTRQVEPCRTTLVEGVSVFHLQYCDTQSNDWTEQWNSTNSLPRMVQVTLGLGKPHGRASAPHELVSRIVALPANSVAGDLQGAFTIPGIPTNRPPGSVTNSPPGRARAPALEAAASEPAAIRSLTKIGDKHRKPPPPRGPKHHGKHDHTYDVELEWLGRSGVELARYVLAMESGGPSDSLMQKWAGGPGDPNSPVAGLPLGHYRLGDGTVSVRIVDLDRKFNLNVADEVILRHVLALMGVDTSAQAAIVDSILDWRDPDDTPRPSGVESDFYRSGWPPYWAKNGPIDHLSELLWIQGITPDLYWGSTGGGNASLLGSGIGLAELYTSLSSGRINVNTASAEELQLIPGIDLWIAQEIVLARTGPDGVDGTDDDQPFRSVAELARVPGLPPIIAQQLRGYLTTRSLVFEVTVEVHMGGEQRTYTGVLRRSTTQDVELLYYYQE